MTPTSVCWSSSQNILLLLAAAYISFPLAALTSLLFLLYSGAKLIYLKSQGMQEQPTPFSNPSKILITGASSGIGEGLALSYAKDKATLFLIGRSVQRLESVTKACTQLGAKVFPIEADVTDEKTMTKVIKDLDQEHQIDLVIANAGVGGHMLDEKLSFEDKTRQILRTNVDGVFNTILPLIESFKNRGKGQIAVVSSLAGVISFPRSAAYNASKSILNTYCRDMRDVLRHYNVSVCSILPGYVRSNMTESDKQKNPNKKMPFFWETDRAIEYIKYGLRNDISVIAFPFPMYAVCFLVSTLPPFILEQFYKLVNLSKGTSWKKLP